MAGKIVLLNPTTAAYETLASATLGTLSFSSAPLLGAPSTTGSAVDSKGQRLGHFQRPGAAGTSSVVFSQRKLAIAVQNGQYLHVPTITQ